MNLYECEGKRLFEKHGIAIPKGICIHRGEDSTKIYHALGFKNVIAKAQVLCGKRGKNNAIKFCGNENEVKQFCNELFTKEVRGQYVAAVRIEEKLDIAEEHYLSITYDTGIKQPVLIYSQQGGVDIEEVEESKIEKYVLDVRSSVIASPAPEQARYGVDSAKQSEGIAASPSAPRNDGLWKIAQELWNCFLQEDARLVEINPLVKTIDGKWIAADAKVALDDDASFRHEEWKNLEPRTMLGRLPSERELVVRKIDQGEAWYRGTAGKYIEMNGDIAVLFSGGGASIANMDALIAAGLKPANYTEYSGNPPRDKVYQLAKIALSKPGLRGLWIVGGVANFTNVAETFQGIVDALDEIKPNYPIVARRAGPHEKEGMQLMRECVKRNNLNMKLFGKEISMSASAKVLADMVSPPPTPPQRGGEK